MNILMIQITIHFQLSSGNRNFDWNGHWSFKQNALFFKNSFQYQNLISNFNIGIEKKSRIHDYNHYINLELVTKNDNLSWKDKKKSESSDFLGSFVTSLSPYLCRKLLEIFRRGGQDLGWDPTKIVTHLNINYYFSEDNENDKSVRNFNAGHSFPTL